MESAYGQKSRPKQQKRKKRGAYDSSDSSEEEERLPLGHDYAGAFPALPDADGRGARMRQANERR